MAEDWIRALAASPWLLPALFLMVVGDAFVVVLPSETLVVALGTLAAATGRPSLGAVIPVAAAGAVAGDSALFWIGRRLGVARWRWQRAPRVASLLQRTRGTVLERPAVLIFTARYIPFARIAVNLSAGAAGLPYRTFLPLSGAAGVGWACLNAGVGAGFGAVLGQHPLVAVICSVVAAIVLGLAIDAIVRRVGRWRGERGAAGQSDPR